MNIFKVNKHYYNSWGGKCKATYIVSANTREESIEIVKSKHGGKKITSVLLKLEEPEILSYFDDSWN